MEYGSVATSWSPAPEDISVENIYTDGTTTIDGGKIYTGSVKAKQIDVEDIFAQDITATGTITGATLKGTTIEVDTGKIAGFSVDDEKLSYVDPVIRNTDGLDFPPYQGFSRINTLNYTGKVNLGAGVWLNATYPCFEQGYVEKLSEDKAEEVITFSTNMFGSYSHYFECDCVLGSLIPMSYSPPTSNPNLSELTYYRGDLGRETERWNSIYAHNIYLGIETGEYYDYPVGNLEATRVYTDEAYIKILHLLIILLYQKKVWKQQKTHIILPKIISVKLILVCP